MKLRVTKKTIQKLLSESVYTPGLPGPMQFVSENASPDYCETRAMELVGEAKISTPEDYHTRMKQAVSLLILARALRGTAEKPTPQGTNGERDTKENSQQTNP